MPLPRPTLDNRTFDQLVAEGTARLPRLAPDWTDYNASDPGITLLELLAARTESAIYRLDRTPPALIRSFLRLTGVAPAPARCAEVVVIVTSSAAPANLPAGIQLGNHGGETLFQTTEALHVSDARLLSVTAGGIDATLANALSFADSVDDGSGGWAAFGPAPAPGACLCLGFDRPLGAPGTSVQLHAWTTRSAADFELRRRLLDEYEAERAEALAACPGASSTTVPDWTLHHGVRTVWEYFDGGSAWQPLARVEDATRALSLTGPVRFEAPAHQQPGGPDAPDTSAFYVRCRLVSGVYDGPPPRLARVALNAVAARHAVDIAATETLGTSEGHANETFPLAAAPVVPASTRLTVTLPAGADPGWLEVPDRDLSGPLDRHCLLDAGTPSAGATIASGNGAAGRVFPAGAAIAIDYQVGSGSAGNLARGSLARIPASTPNAARYQAANGSAPDWSRWSVEQPVAARGGADAETLAAAEVRANAHAFAASRAITLDDFGRLACAVPGLPVARACALADHHPDLPCFPAPGSVTVVVVPAGVAVQPVPSGAFLAGVARFLARRRSVATEVHVVAPSWRTVVVSATLHLDRGVDPMAATRRARAALDAFFDPLNGGPAGDGWPIGRTVYRAEIFALLAAEPGVLAVTALGLAFAQDTEPGCANLAMCPDALVRSGLHRLATLGVAAPPLIDRSKPHECQ